MDNIALNKLVAERQQKCEERHICIDTMNGTAKGYTKVKHVQAIKNSCNKADRDDRKELITSLPQKELGLSEVYTPFSKGNFTPCTFVPQKQRVPNPDSLSEADLFKDLGVDYIG